MIQVRILTPHTTPRPRKLDEVAGLMPEENCEFSHEGLTEGPPSVESVLDEVLSAPYVVARCIAAEAEGVDAVIVDCMGDPGVDAARDAVAIPILGPGDTSMHVASMLGHRYGVVTISDRVRPIFERHALRNGTSRSLAGVRSVDISVLHLEDDRAALVDALFRESVASIVADHADVIVLGCTGFLGVSEELQRRLRAAGHRAPVVNPLRTTAMIAYSLASIGLSHPAPLS